MPNIKLAWTQENERWLRAIIMQQWEAYFAQRRKKEREKLARLLSSSVASAHSMEATKLQKSKFVRRETPEGLSGACKIVSQVALQVFPIDGTVISNSHHTFILMAGGREIYDFNRHCGDALRLQAKGKRPYKVNRKYSESAVAVSGRQSWNKEIAKIMELVQQRVTTDQPAPKQWRRSKLIQRVPLWAEPISPD